MHVGSRHSGLSEYPVMLFGFKWPNRTWMSSDNGNEQRLITFHVPVECRNPVLHMGHVNLPSQEWKWSSNLKWRCAARGRQKCKNETRVGDLAYNVTAEGCLHTPRRPTCAQPKRRRPATRVRRKD